MADLKSLTRALNETLEERIGALLGDVMAARELARSASETESELERQLALNERAQAKARQLGNKGNAAEAAKLESQTRVLTSNIAKLEQRRDNALADLEKLTNELGHE